MYNPSTKKAPQRNYGAVPGYFMGVGLGVGITTILGGPTAWPTARTGHSTRRWLDANYLLYHHIAFPQYSLSFHW